MTRIRRPSVVQELEFEESGGFQRSVIIYICNLPKFTIRVIIGILLSLLPTRGHPMAILIGYGIVGALPVIVVFVWAFTLR